MASSMAVPIIPDAIISSTDRIARAHQASFYARGLLKIGAVSENAPGVHRDVPRAADIPRTGPPDGVSAIARARGSRGVFRRPRS